MREAPQILPPEVLFLVAEYIEGDSNSRNSGARWGISGFPNQYTRSALHRIAIREGISTEI